MAQENISSELENLLVTRNFDVDVKDKDGNDSTPDQAKTFSFDYVASSGNNYGRMVLVLQDGNTLLIMFGDNLGRSIEDPTDRQEFYDFQQQLHSFANRNFYKPSTMDISKIKHVMRGMAAIKESLFESYYGNRRVSYMGAPTEARLVINHARLLGEHDARHRYIDSIFIETGEGERYKLQYKNIAGAKAMLEHVRQGGRPYDVRGNHITEMMNEIAVLSRFRRASSTRVLEGVTADIVTEAETYYQQLRETVRRMSSTTGYNTYFESWEPTEIALHEELVDSIKTMFIEQTLDSRIEAALPLLARLRQNNMEEIRIFETWANNLVEGTWALPDTPEKWEKLQTLMSEPLMVGPGAMNATEQLDDILGDDQLFDRLQELAKEDPNANCWDDTEVQARMRQLGVALNTAPAAMAEPAAPTTPQAVTEARVNEIAPFLAPLAAGAARFAAPYASRAIQAVAPGLARTAQQAGSKVANYARGQLSGKPANAPGGITSAGAGMPKPAAPNYAGGQLAGKPANAPAGMTPLGAGMPKAPATPAMTAGTRAPQPPADSGGLGQKIISGAGALAAGLGLPFAALNQSGKTQQPAAAAPASAPASSTTPAAKPAVPAAPAAKPAVPAPAAKPAVPAAPAVPTVSAPAAPVASTLPAAPYDGAAARAMASPSTTASAGSASTNTAPIAAPAAPEGTTARLDQLKSNIAAGGSNPGTAVVPTDTGIEKIDTTEGDNLNSFEEGVDDPMNYNAAITGSYYESRSDDALLARIKSLAMLK
jgi:hypothetical protein